MLAEGRFRTPTARGDALEHNDGIRALVVPRREFVLQPPVAPRILRTTSPALLLLLLFFLSWCCDKLMATASTAATAMASARTNHEFRFSSQHPPTRESVRHTEIGAGAAHASHMAQAHVARRADGRAGRRHVFNAFGKVGSAQHQRLRLPIVSIARRGVGAPCGPRLTDGALHCRRGAARVAGFLRGNRLPPHPSRHQATVGRCVDPSSGGWEATTCPMPRGRRIVTVPGFPLAGTTSRACPVWASTVEVGSIATPLDSPLTFAFGEEADEGACIDGKLFDLL